jgi:hypothetical protein
LIGDKLVAETEFAGDSWRSPVGASEKRTGFGEWAMSAMLAKVANSVLLAALRAVGFVDNGAASGGVNCVAWGLVSRNAYLATEVESRCVGWSCGVAASVARERQAT